MRHVFLFVCFLCGANVMAQNNEERDVEFGMELKTEIQATDKGCCNYVNFLHLNASLPVSESVSFDAASISTCMTASESIGDDLQTFSNLDAGNILFALSVLGVNWQIKDNHSLFMGIRNMNEDYFTSAVTSFFTNSSCGIYPTISANYPIANYPVASVGMHYRFEKESDNGKIAVQASLYNGTGYNRLTGRDNVFRVCPKDDGVFCVAEVSFTKGFNYYSLGSAMHYNENMSIAPWFYLEQSLTSNLTLLAGYSHAFTEDAECKDFIGCGVHYLLGKCQLGVFTDYANFEKRNEFATELTCKIPISRHVDIQPTAHFITYDSRLHSVAMLRMAISF